MAGPAEKIVRLKHFDAARLTIGHARPTKAGGKSIPIYLNGEKPVLQVPKHGTYGLSGQLPPDTPPGNPQGLSKKYSVNLKAPNGGLLCEKMKEVDQWVLEYVTAHGGELLGQADQPEAVIKALSYPIVKYPKDKDTGKVFYDRDPTVKLKVSYWDGKWNLELFDSEKNTIFEKGMTVPSDPDDPESEPMLVDPTDPELAPSGTEMVSIIQCDGIWVASGRFGVTWRLVQAEVKQPVRIKGFCIQPESDDEDGDEETGEGAGEDAAAVGESPEAEGEGEGEGEGKGEEQEGVPSPEPEPKPKAKRSRKKAT